MSIYAPPISANAIQAFVATSQTTTSTTYVDLATVTDTVTLNIGVSGLALVSIYCGEMDNSAALSRTFASFAVSGATTQAASDNLALQIVMSNGSLPQMGAGATFLVTGLTPGSTTFKMKYRVDSGTGTFVNRRISVVPL